MSSDPPVEGELIMVAAVARAHALRGAVILKPFTRDPELLATAGYDIFRLRKPGNPPREFEILSITPFGDGMLLANFEGVTNRTAAEALIGSEVLIPRDERWETDEGEFFVEDLIGLDVREETPEGRLLGKVTDIREGVGHDHLVFPHPDKPGRDVLLPFVDAFVLEVDPSAGRVLVRLPQGLLEL